MSILAVNAGSSSLKFALYPPAGVSELQDPVLSGVIEGLEANEPLRLRYTTLSDAKSSAVSQSVTTSIDLKPNTSAFEAALQALKTLVTTNLGSNALTAVAHRVVHGGIWYREAVRVDEQVFQRLESLNALAPLHQPHNLQGIKSFQAVYSRVPQIACFDTAFHASLPNEEYLFALPSSYADQGIRRYGFHGLSYEYLRAQLRRLSTRAEQRVVMAHLGNGASLCGMYAGESKATTMGFSAVEGSMMGTRSGSMDPGVLLHLLAQGQTAADLTRLLYKQSGLLGVSGVAADMRTLRSSDQDSAKLAIGMFTHRVVRESGAIAACLQGIDVLVFTGGIGEHDAQLRHDVCQRLSYLGLAVDAEKNRLATGDQAMRIDAQDSRVEIWVIPTDEGRMAALSARAVLQAGA